MPTYYARWHLHLDAVIQTPIFLQQSGGRERWHQNAIDLSPSYICCKVKSRQHALAGYLGFIWVKLSSVNLDFDV